MKTKTIKLEPVEEMLLETLNRANYPYLRKIAELEDEIEKVDAKRAELQKVVDGETARAFKIISDMRGETIPVNAVPTKRDGDRPPELTFKAEETSPAKKTKASKKAS